MQEIKGIDELRDRIKILKKQRDQEWKALKVDVRDQLERLKPSNFIRNAFEGITGSINAKPDILQEGAGLAAGLLVNSVVGKKHRGLKKWLKIALYYVITYFVTRHREDILDAGRNMVDFVSDRLKAAQNKDDVGKELVREAMGED